MSTLDLSSQPASNWENLGIRRDPGVARQVSHVLASSFPVNFLTPLPARKRINTAPSLLPLPSITSHRVPQEVLKDKSEKDEHLGL